MKFYFMSPLSMSSRPSRLESALFQVVSERFQYHMLSENDVPALVSALRSAERKACRNNRYLARTSVDEVISPTNAAYHYLNIGSSFFQLVECQGPCEQIRSIELSLK